jgi:hypothetical protein
MEIKRKGFFRLLLLFGLVLLSGCRGAQQMPADCGSFAADKAVTLPVPNRTPTSFRAFTLVA